MEETITIAEFAERLPVDPALARFAQLRELEPAAIRIDPETVDQFLYWSGWV